VSILPCKIVSRCCATIKENLGNCKVENVVLMIVGASNATFPTFGGFSISDRRIFTKNHSLFQNQGNVCVLLRQICCLKQTRELRQRYSASFWHFEANDFGSTYIYPYAIRRRVSAGDIS